MKAMMGRTKNRTIRENVKVFISYVSWPCDGGCILESPLV